MKKKISKNNNKKKTALISKKAPMKSRLAAIKKKASGSAKMNVSAKVPDIKVIVNQTPRFQLHRAMSFLNKRLVIWIAGVSVFLAVFSVIAFSNNFSAKKSTMLNSGSAQTSTLSLFKDNDTVTLIATGDILLARYVEKRMRDLGDYTFPFKKVADVLKSADVTFGNLETPLMPGRNTPTGSMIFRGDLDGVKGLLFAGYDVLSLANNHTMNYQIPGLTSTLVTLKNAGILASGGGKNQTVAHTPAIFEAKGKKLAFLSYVDSSIPPGFHGEATGEMPGIAGMNIEEMKTDVKNASAQADFVIVSMHAGREYEKTPTKFQTDFAHAAIDAGAAVVIGHHPHVVQPMEEYGNGVILYSLGNFVFDQAFSEDVKSGLVAKFQLEAGKKPKLEILPVKIEKTQPRFLEGEEGAAELKRIGF